MIGTFLSKNRSYREKCLFTFVKLFWSRFFLIHPVVGFKRGKSLKDHLVRAKVPKLDRCTGGECSIKTENNLSCDSKHIVVYFVTCKTCKIQYVCSASTPFRLRFNKYNSGSVSSQDFFHAHFAQEGHHGMEDWEFILLNKAHDLPSVRRKEAFWQQKLNTFSPDGLNERYVPVDFG